MQGSGSGSISAMRPAGNLPGLPPPKNAGAIDEEHERWLITVRKDPGFPIEPVMARWDRSHDLVREGVGFLLYGLLGWNVRRGDLWRIWQRPTTIGAVAARLARAQHLARSIIRDLKRPGAIHRRVARRAAVLHTLNHHGREPSRHLPRAFPVRAGLRQLQFLERKLQLEGGLRTGDKHTIPSHAGPFVR